MKQLCSPYRICPIGAHIDHQGGPVLGRTINIGTMLEYESLDSKEICLASDQFGESKFLIGDLDVTHWTRYATHHLEENIIEYVGDGSKGNLDVTFAHQTALNGNGGALMSVLPEWIRDEPVMAVATDYLLEENCLSDLVNAHKQYNADITMSLKEGPVEELMSRSSVEWTRICG